MYLHHGLFLPEGGDRPGTHISQKHVIRSSGRVLPEALRLQQLPHSVSLRANVLAVPVERLDDEHLDSDRREVEGPQHLELAVLDIERVVVEAPHRQCGEDVAQRNTGHSNHPSLLTYH